MIQSIRDYYKMELEENKGKIYKMEELPVDLMFMTMPADVQKTLVVPYLANEGKLKIYLGIQTNSSIIPTIIEKVGELAQFNENKTKAFVDTQKIKAEIAKELGDLYETDKEEFDKQFKEKFDARFQEEAQKERDIQKLANELTTEKSEIKIHKDEFMLIAHNVDIKDYQRVISTIKEEGYSVYNEYVFVEVL